MALLIRRHGGKGPGGLPGGPPGQRGIGPVVSQLILNEGLELRAVDGGGWAGAGIAGTGVGSGAVTWGIYPCMYWGAGGHSAAGTGSMGLSAPPERVTRPHTRSKISRSLPQSPGPGCGI